MLSAVSALPYTSLPRVSDFEHPDLAPVLEEAHRHIAGGTGWRPPLIDRKSWEVAMAVRALRDHGALRPDAEILGVGAGFETTGYVLTRHVRRVFATDLYVDPGTWEHTANLEVLVAPERFFGGEWNPRRLVMQHMDALDLRYEDESFDGIFSSSSIEHFGDFDAVRRSAQEMYRVLKPGGVCSLSTEFRLAGPSGFALPDALAFTGAELQRLLVDGIGWELVGDLDALVLDEETAGVVVDFNESAADVRAGRPEWSTYPHLVLKWDGGHEWTSVHVTLRKP